MNAMNNFPPRISLPKPMGRLEMRAAFHGIDMIAPFLIHLTAQCA